MDNSIETLRTRQDELVADSQSILARADSDKRELDDEEQARLDANTNEVERLQADIERREKVMAQSQMLVTSAGRKTAPSALSSQRSEETAPQAGTRRVEPQPRDVREHGKWGFRSFGEFAMSVRRLQQRIEVDPRIEHGMKAAATTYGNEAVGEQGGILVPGDFRNEIFTRVLGEDSLASRCDVMTSGSNTFTFPSDDTTPWQTTGGILAYWEAEGGTLTQSRPQFKSNSLRLNKLTALMPVTEELLEDAPALDSYLRMKAPQKIDFKLSLAILQGTGSGQPLGILNAPCTTTVAKESSQAADTLLPANIRKMWTAMYAPCRGRAVWLAHQDIEPELFKLQELVKNVAGTENVGGYPLYLPPGGLSASPYGTLFGRPIVYTEACETLGDLGDIILADMSQYLLVRKSIGMKVETSIHLYFDQDMTAYRFVLRVGGMPWWGSSIASRDGSGTRSPFVLLQAR